MSYYSVSRIETYNSCPKKYKFRYIDRITPPKGEMSLNILVGNSVHKTLETVYREYMKTRKLVSFEEMMVRYSQIWDTYMKENVVTIHISQDPEDFKKEGESILVSYYNKEIEKEKMDQTIAVERSFFVILEDYKLKAVIDRIDYRDENTFLIYDYKTTSHFPEKKNLEDDMQLPLYQMAIKQTYPDVKRVLLNWHFLRFNKTISISKEENDLTETKKRILDNIRAIELDRNFEANKTPLCDYCPYQDICPAFKHLFTLENLENQDLDEGYQAVNKIAEISTEIKEHQYALKKLKEEQEEWEERAELFAVEHEMSALEGDTHELIINRKKEISFPDSKDPARIALESFLKDNNLWEQVSIMYGPKIKKVISNSSLEKKILEELMGFSFIKEKTSFRLKKK